MSRPDKPSGAKGAPGSRIGEKRPSISTGKESKDVVFKTSFRNCILDAMKKRGWNEVDKGSKDWDFHWADVHWVAEYFREGNKLSEGQRLNHFPNHYELTRKDLLTKNVKKAKRQLEREGRVEEAKKYEFVPCSFVVPAEYGPFLEEFKKGMGDYDYDHSSGIDNRELLAKGACQKASNVWIMKPIGSAQGKGIFLFNKLSQISDWKASAFSGKSKDDDKGGGGPETYIAQRYLYNPYLVGGRKFDLRMYALVTSFGPLTVWLSRTGFARFSNHRFSMKTGDIKNAYIHLTNVAIQKTDANYDAETGCKWSLHSLKQYLISRHGLEATNKCFHEMQNIIIRSLLGVQKVIINDRKCFEMYGYDIMIDDDLTPWLIEVNASPSISADTKEDYELKVGVLSDLLTIIDIEKKLTGTEAHIGSFDLVYMNGPIKVDPASELTTYLGAQNHHGMSIKKLEKLYGKLES